MLKINNKKFFTGWITNNELKGNFTCPHCSKTYRYMSGLRRHRKFECGVEPQFACPVCGKKFRQKTYIKIHISQFHAEMFSSE